MTFILVLLFWAAVAIYVPFHFRKAIWIRSFFRAAAYPWYCIAQVNDPDFTDWINPGKDDQYDYDAAERGFVAGILSIVLAALIVVAFAGFTLYLAW